ncbi:MAG: hypothetical protein JNG83_07975 [Opitutaceae bacterium]|nr:hypothetical protein [Opitutaceae bacterium]
MLRFLRALSLIIPVRLALVLALGSGAVLAATEPVIDLGMRRELFVDDLLLERLDGGAARRQHHPEAREVAIVHDAPWEGNGCGYHSVFQDGAIYRMYYMTQTLTVAPGAVRKAEELVHFCCYAESDDGIHWRKPNLGLYEFQGSKANNIVMTVTPGVNADPGHPAVFRDDHPATPPDARYKAVLRGRDPKGLVLFKSPDAIHWSPLRTEPVITGDRFDSQNLAFWDVAAGTYRAYWRHWSGDTDARSLEGKAKGFRGIRTATSPDLLHWSEPRDLQYGGAPDEHLYTSQVKPYHRAPHLLLGFPARYVERTWSDALRALPDRTNREVRSGMEERYGTALTEGVLMTSRDGVNFQRWPEAFLRPGPERPGTWNYGHQYIAWHLVETRSALPGAPNELSLYADEDNWVGTASAARRYTLRLDGFVSVRAPLAGGEARLRPVRFAGDRLFLNFSTSAAGGVRVELQDLSGQPYPGFSLADCPPLFGDAIEREVIWSGGASVGVLAGRPVRIRLVLRDADVFAFRFGTAPAKPLSSTPQHQSSR